MTINNNARLAKSETAPRKLAGPARKLLQMASFSMACTGAVDVIAQQPSAGVLEEVVVTATRRTENLQQVALSVTALNEQYLEDRGIASFADLGKAASGLNLVQSESATGTALRIRGVGVRPNSPLDSSVGVLQDDVYQARPGFSFQELLDVQSVEVMRGPQGTLFGKNTIVGVIKINTNVPDLNEFSGHLQAVGGNLSTVEARGTVNIPIIDGKLAARISGFDASRDGYTDNLYLNEETRDADRNGGRAKLRWAASDALTFDFSYDNMKSKSNHLDTALVSYGPTSLSQLAAAGFDPANFPLELGKTYEDVHGKGWDELERYIGRVEWDAGDVIVKLLAAHEDVKTYVRNDQNRNITTGGVPGYLVNENESKINTLEFQLVSNFDGPLSFIAGTFFQQNELNSYTTLGSTTYLDIPGRIGPPTGFDDPYYLYPRPVSAADNKSLAGFGTVTYEFTDSIKASFGARYTDDQKENTGAPGTYADFKEWTYSGSVQFQMHDDLMFYVAAAKGFTSGGFNRPDIVAAVGEQYLTYDPVTTYNYEVGIKSEWFENRARLNVSIFDQTFDQYQVTQSVVGAGNVFVTNAAKVKSQGIETDFTLLATDHLTFDGSISYVKTEYDDFVDAPCTYIIPGNPPQVSPASCMQQPGGGYGQDLSGKTLDNAPEWTGNVGAEYSNNLPFGGLEWFVRADAVYRDDTFLDVTQDRGAEQEAYTLYSARIGVESPDNGWKLTVWGNNLGDEDYGIYADVNEFGVQMYQGLTRTYGATLDYNF